MKRATLENICATVVIVLMLCAETIVNYLMGVLI